MDLLKWTITAFGLYHLSHICRRMVLHWLDFWSNDSSPSKLLFRQILSVHNKEPHWILVAFYFIHSFKPVSINAWVGISMNVLQKGGGEYLYLFFCLLQYKLATQFYIQKWKAEPVVFPFYKPGVINTIFVHKLGNILFRKGTLWTWSRVN